MPTFSYLSPPGDLGCNTTDAAVQGGMQGWGRTVNIIRIVMLLIYRDMPLAGILEDHPFLMPVLDRFGIPLGLGESTVEQVCVRQGIDTVFFLMVLNTFLNEGYFPQEQFAAFHAEQIVDYLSKTHAYYRRFQLPNIERHLKGFIASGRGENPALALVGDAFSKAKARICERMERDENEFFPYVLRLCRSVPQADLRSMSPVQKGAADQEYGWEQLHDIKSVLGRHLRGTYDPNLCYAVLFAVSAFEKDMRLHERIRHRILIPMVHAMERGGKNTGRDDA